MNVLILLVVVCLGFGGDVGSSRNEIYVISDTHLGDSQHTSDDTNKAVVRFLQSLTDPNTSVHSLFLNGDVVDLWTIPFQVKPQFPSEIFVSELYNDVNMKVISDLLNHVMDNNINIVYIRGNHDDFTNQEYLNEAGLERIKYYPFEYQGNNFEIHHGYEWTLNNMLRPSPPEKKEVMKAWSYYTVRAKITHFLDKLEEEKSEEKENGTNEKSLKFDPLHFYQEICENILADKFSVEAIEDNAWWYEYDIDRQIGGGNPFDMKMYNAYKDKVILGGDFNSYNSENTTLATAVEKFKNDIKLWIDTHGIDYVQKMISADPCLDYDHWIETSEKPVFLMGHTHLTEFQVKKNGTQLYVNSGCWLTNQAYFPVIRMFTNEEKTDHVNKVELCGFEPDDQTLKTYFSSDIPIPKKHEITSEEL